MHKRCFNFSPGPSTLPLSILEQAQSEFLNYKGKGMSVMEMSHRSKEFLEIYENSIENLKKIAKIPQDFDVLYMTGGASTQFALAPMNLVKENKKAAYINTGTWSIKAIKQANIILEKKNVDVLASSEEQNFNYIPKNFDHNNEYSYLHITSNNTIYGTEYHKWPQIDGCRLVVDMSSNFLSAPIEDYASWDKTGIIYAGAQKNLAPSGLTVVIIHKDYYNRENEKTPSLFRYSTFANSQSMHNTPPTFQIYMLNLMLEWMIQQGGLEKIKKNNVSKANLIYQMIDKYPDFYKGHAVTEDRSFMNITWRLRSEEMEKKFLVEAEEKELSGLKGHRSVGGIRASVYNAMPLEGCEKIADYMQEFAKTNA